MIDQLREDLRDLYSRQQADLGDLQATRRRVIQAALVDRDEPAGGRLHFAAGIAAVLLAALVVATFAYMRAGSAPHLVRPSNAPPVPISAPKKPVAPAGFTVLDAAPLNASTGWVLISNCIQPIRGHCHYAVAQTSDAGRTWSKPVQVGPSSDGSDAGVPRKLTFINGNDGFAYGSTWAFETHDGGRTWMAVALRPSWFALIEGRGTTAWVMSYPCAKGTLCPYEVRSSMDAGRTWSAPHSLPSLFSPLAGFAIGDAGLLLWGVPTSEIELTLDRGTTWSSIATPCPATTFRSVVTTSDGSELWLLCLGNLKPGTSKLFVSADGGKSWRIRTSRPATAKQLPMDYSTMLVSTHPGTALMASNVMMIAITHDGGLTWTTVGPDAVLFQSMSFANATDGWALDVNQDLWTTSDGGDHWH